MSTLSDLRTPHRANGRPASSGPQEATIRSTAAADGEPVWVTIDAESSRHKRGPAKWTPNGTRRPKDGDPALVERSDKGELWVTAWWPMVDFDPELDAILFAGDGLTRTADTVNVGAGPGITVSADEVAVAIADGGGLQFDEADLLQVDLDPDVLEAAAAGITVKAGAITSTHLAPNSVSGEKIIAGSISATHIAAGQINATHVAAGSITAGHIAAGTITGDRIAAGTITAGNIQAGTITATQIAATTITAAQIAAGTITAGQIAAGTITATEIAAATITASLIAAGTITATQIAAGTITGSLIAAGTITGDRLIAGTITATQIAAATITGDRLVANTITAGKIQAGTITAAEIAAGTLTGDRIAAGTVTATNIAAATITGDLLAAATITGDRLVSGAVTADKISVSSLSAVSSNMGTITAGTITGATIQSAASGARWRGNTTGLTLFNAADVVTFHADTSTGKITTLAGIGGGNVARNSRFEAPIGASGIGWTLTGGNFAIETGFDHGPKAIRLGSVDGSASGNDFIRQDFTLPTGTWTFSTWSTCTGCTAGGGRVSQNIDLIAGTATGTLDVDLGAGANPGTVGWTRISTTIEVTSSTATFAVHLQKGRLANLNGRAWFTEVQVEPGALMTGYAPKPDEILPQTISGGSVGAASPIVPGTIVGGDLVADTITATQIAASAVTAVELAANAVIAGKIAAGTIVAGDIASGTITATQIASGTITATQIAANTITAAKIAAGTITATEIAANTITAAKIAAGTITATEIAANTITAAKIASGTITATQIAAGTITADRLNVTQLSAITGNLGTITAGTVTGALIRTDSTGTRVEIDNASDSVKFYEAGSPDVLRATMSGPDGIAYALTVPAAGVTQVTEGAKLLWSATDTPTYAHRLAPTTFRHTTPANNRNTLDLRSLPPVVAGTTGGARVTIASERSGGAATHTIDADISAVQHNLVATDGTRYAELDVYASSALASIVAQVWGALGATRDATFLDKDGNTTLSSTGSHSDGKGPGVTAGIYRSHVETGGGARLKMRSANILSFSWTGSQIQFLVDGTVVKTI